MHEELVRWRPTGYAFTEALRVLCLTLLKWSEVKYLGPILHAMTGIAICFKYISIAEHGVEQHLSL